MFVFPGWPMARERSGLGGSLRFALLLVLGTALQGAQAATATVQTLHTFSIGGQYPVGALAKGSDSNFYGTTSEGGTLGNGTVFRITPAGALTTLHTFDNSNGKRPIGGLTLASDGAFYGTTESGGSSGQGTIFKVTSAGLHTVLIHFSGSNGSFPHSPPIQGSDGNFYGVASQGGASGNGVVYKLTPAGVYSVLASFDGVTGQFPNGALVQGADGNFYGTTEAGGSGSGTVFRITASGTLTTQFSFDGTRGAKPEAALVQGGDGNFYGTTDAGGAASAGAVFRMTPAGTLTLLASLGGTKGTGSRAALVAGGDGQFYGTTSDTLFRITPSGTFTTLYTFSGPDSGSPQAGLARGDDGNFYGVTRNGGTSDRGTVFKLLAPPAPPPGLSALSNGDEIVLSWSATAGATTYNIYQGTATGAQGATPVQTGVSSTSATVGSLSSGNYFFTVTAVSANGESGPSNEATAAVNVPTGFSFPPITGATVGTEQLSDTVTVAGLLASTPLQISVSGDTGAAYSINSNPFTTATGNVSNGDRVQARVNASAATSTTTRATITLGRTSTVFSVTTLVPDTSVDAFTFAAVSSAVPGSVQTSAPVLVSGINQPVSISVSGDTGAAYSVNGGPFTATAGTVSNGASVRVRVNAPAALNSSSQVTLMVSAASAAFAVDTNADSTPNVFVFTAVSGATISETRTSNAVTLSGFNTPLAVSVSGSPGAAYSINGGAFTSAAGTANSGDVIRVQVEASPSPSTATSATLGVGGVNATYTVTTAAATAAPAATSGGSLDAMLLLGLLLLRGRRR